MSYTVQDAEAACDGLARAVDRLLDRYEQRNKSGKLVPAKIRQSTRILVRHIRYCFVTLTRKRIALVALLQWYGSVVWKELVDGERLQRMDIAELTATFQHMMQVMLIAIDGMVMLTSGECRHSGDVRTAAKLKFFKSRLGTLSTRSDGYTCLYKSSATYSGFGWDEWANEDVGLHVRLCECLAPYHNKSRSNDLVWDYLLANGCQMLDSLLDQHETAMRQVHDQINELKNRVLQDLQTQLLPLQLSFRTQDKMEQFHIQLATNARTHGTSEPAISIKLQRRGDNFQVSNPLGVLPDRYTSSSDWETALPTPWSTDTQEVFVRKKVASAIAPESRPGTSSHKRKRRHAVIDDDDDDDEHEDENTSGGGRRAESGASGGGSGKDESTEHKRKINADDTPTNTAELSAKCAASSRAATKGVGLIVRVEKDHTKEEREESLNAIKQQMGVSVASMQASHDHLLEEGKQASIQNPSAAASASASASNQLRQGIHQRRGSRNGSETAASHENAYAWNDDAVIERSRKKVDAMNAILKRVHARPSIDIHEVWDAREITREANMTFGNDLLWAEDTSIAADARYEQAVHAFLTAEQLVVEQRKEHGTSLVDWDERLIERNLCLLLGQAQVNRGIAYCEWGRQYSKTKPSVASNYAKLALMHLTDANVTAKELRGMSLRDRSRLNNQPSLQHRDWAGAEVDLLHADKLEILSRRWKGIIVWTIPNDALSPAPPSSSVSTAAVAGLPLRRNTADLGREHSASVAEFEQAMALFYTHRFTDRHWKDQDVAQSIIELGMECIDSGLVASDLGHQELQRLVEHERRKKSNSDVWKQNGNIVMEHCVATFLSKCAKVRDSLQSLKQKSTCVSTLDLAMREHGVLDANDIRRQLKDLKTWWNDATTRGPAQLNQSTPNHPSITQRPFQRNELVGTPIVPVMLDSAQRYRGHHRRRQQTTHQNVGDGSTTSINHAGGDERDEFMASTDGVDAPLANNDSEDHSGDDEDDGNTNPSNLALASANQASIRYRKWGDELLPQIVDEQNGECRPDIKYPSVAPPLPAEFREAYDIQCNRISRRRQEEKRDLNLEDWYAFD